MKNDLQKYIKKFTGHWLKINILLLVKSEQCVVFYHL